MKSLEEWLNQLSFIACLAVFTAASIGIALVVSFGQMFFAALY